MARGYASGMVNSFLDTMDDGYIRLHTGDPGAAGATAVSAGDNSRIQITTAAASGGSKAMSGTGGPWTNGGTSESITDVTYWDDGSGTTFWLSAQLGTPQAWADTNTFTLTSFSFSITTLAA